MPPTTRPPDFAAIANADTKNAFLSGHPEVVAWLDRGTKLFKWTQSITTPKGISPWGQFLESRRLSTGAQYDELKDWVGDNYDPDVFSLDNVNRMLVPVRPRRGNTSSG